MSSKSIKPSPDRLLAATMERAQHLPAHGAVHGGPDQVVTFAAPGYQRLAPLGQPIR